MLYDDNLLILDDASSTSQQARGGHGDGARTGASMVRRSRDAGLVGRHLAQRKLRQLDGLHHRRPVAARSRHRGKARWAKGSTRWTRCAGRRPADPASRSKPTAQIDAAFDSITYGKGGHVIAMIAAFMGQEKFRAGVRRYLAAHAYGNATSEDFFDALADAAGDPRIVTAMKGFVRAAGRAAGDDHGRQWPLQGQPGPLCAARDHAAAHPVGRSAVHEPGRQTQMHACWTAQTFPSLSPARDR